MNRVSCVVLVAVAGFVCTSAMAQNVNWRNATNGTFETGTNWVGGLVPNATQNAIFGLNSSANPFTITFTQSETSAGLTVQNQRPTLGLGAFTYTITGNVTIGGANSPSLTLLGGMLQSTQPGTSAVIGRAAGTAGSATISGATAVWQGLDTIGDSGTGSLTVSSGGRVSTGPGQIGWIGHIAGSSGSVTVTGVGSVYTPDQHLEFYVGDAGNGTLIVDQGAHVNSRAAWIGNWASSTSLATVSGAGSTWTNTDILRVGKDGHGTLSVTGAAAVTCLAISAGETPSGSGTITVDGVGTQFTASTSSGNSNIGNQGTGLLTVSAGAVASFPGNYPLFVAGWPNSTGRITVTGSGSQLQSGEGLNIGTGGDGAMVVRNGANTSARWMNIGSDTSTGPARLNVESGGSVALTDHLVVGGHGVVSVSGAGSSVLAPTTGFLVGLGGGGAAFNVMEGGYVQAGLSVGAAGGAGTVSIDGPGSLWTTLSAVIVGNDSSVAANVSITNGGSLECDFAYVDLAPPYVGTVTIDGAESTWFVARDLNVGRVGRNGLVSLRNGGRLFGAPVRLQPTGRLEGIGDVEGFIENNGQLAPGGTTHGIMTVNGNLTQFATGTLSVGLGGTVASTGYDVLAVSGSVTLDGTLSVVLSPGFTPQVGNTFDVVTFGTRSGTFASTLLPTLSGGLSMSLSYEPHGVRLTVVHFCPADFNGDSSIDFFDYLDFVDAFSSNAAGADFNSDGSIDFFDYLDFVDAFSMGC